MPSLGAVLPLKIRGSHGHDDAARVEILFSSLHTFMAPGTLDELTVVSPADEVAQVAAQLRPWADRLPLRFASETDRLPRLADRRLTVSSWVKQMLIKLAHGSAAGTDFILTLDADVVCKRPVARSDLLVDGRALLQRQPAGEIPNFACWYASAASLLQLPPASHSLVMSVTPALLSREICRSLTRRLEQAYGLPWSDYLISLDTAWHRNLPPWRGRREWTEYSLYYLHACASAQCDRYHTEAGTRRAPATLLSRHSLWYRADSARWRADACFAAADPALFAVIQSSTGLEAAEVRHHLAPYLALGTT